MIIIGSLGCAVCKTLLLLPPSNDRRRRCRLYVPTASSRSSPDHQQTQYRNGDDKDDDIFLSFFECVRVYCSTIHPSTHPNSLSLPFGALLSPFDVIRSIRLVGHGTSLHPRPPSFFSSVGQRSVGRCAMRRTQQQGRATQRHARKRRRKKRRRMGYCEQQQQLPAPPSSSFKSFD